MTESVTFKYRAFLSYSHRDTAWGKWLHASLEGYRIDKELVGRATPVGPVPKSLRPIFRDREDFSAGHSLNQQTMAALEGSAFLVVVCSPNAARSIYVNEEIRLFKALGRSDRVIPVIVAGEPGDPEQECFPPALRFKVGADGAFADAHEEPIAADARSQGDGKEIAKLKLVAGLLGLGFDEIVRRSERARKRRNRFWASLAGAFLILTIAATSSAVFAFQKVIESEERLDQAIEIAYGFVSEATSMSDQFGIPVDVTLGLLKRAEIALNTLIAKTQTPSPTFRYRKSLMLLSFALNYEKLGQTGDAIGRAGEARDLLRGLSAEDPRNLDWRASLAQALANVGAFLLVERKLPEALESLREALDIDRALLVARPGNIIWQQFLMQVRVMIGDALAYQGKLREATESYMAALGDMNRFAAALSRPLADILVENPVLQPEMIEAANRIGVLQAMQGHFAEARKYFESILAVREYLASKAPQSLYLQTGILDSHYRLGGLYLDIGEFSNAERSFRKALAIVEPIVAADRKNALARRQTVLMKDGIARATFGQGATDQALALFRDNLVSSREFVAADPRHAVWRSYVAIGHERIGDALFKLGDLPAALTSYREELSIFGDLATTRQMDIEMQYAFSTALFKIGEVLRRQGLSDEALSNFRASLQMFDLLLASNADVISYKAGHYRARWRILEETDGAPSEKTSVLAALRELRDSGKLTFIYRTWLEATEAELAAPTAH